jgi:hypothetical protein
MALLISSVFTIAEESRETKDNDRLPGPLSTLNVNVKF